MQGLNLAELLLLVIVLQQGVAAPIWWACARVGVAPRVPGLHWAVAAAWASVSLGLTLFARDPWYAHGLANMLAPGIFLLLRLGLQILFRAPRHDGENLMVILLSVGGAIAGELAGAPIAWAVWLSSLLNAFCLWRAAQVVGPLAREELGELPAKLLVWPLRATALLFTVRLLLGLVRSTETAVYLNQATTANLIVLALLMTFGLLLHLTLGLAIALRLMARLRQLTRTDSLTGLPNRRAADEMIEQLREARQRLGEPAGLLVIDADHFKRVNDQHGHLVGDRALVHLAAVLRAGLRGADVVARVGGEELLVLLPQTERATALELAERLRARVEAQPLRSGSREVPLTVSIGVALLRAGESSETWQARADAAMYRAKQQGRNRVCTEGEG
jgi:diguanylate cyclase (GGDEF)-like protein